LPWDEFADSPKAKDVRVCVVCNEISSACTDILLVERTLAGTGRFVVIETKLVKNPEIYRDVLGQVLEYASYLSSSETSDSLEHKAKAYWKERRREGGTDFQGEMKRVFGSDWRKEIWNTAVENARDRNIRLLIASDSLPKQLRLAVTYLPSSLLLSAIEFHAHSAESNKRPSAFTGAASANGTVSTADQSALHEYFSNVTLSHATVQYISTGSVISQAHDRGKPTIPRPVRPYEDHLAKLGENTVPGQALRMLKEQAEQTGGHLHEGGKYLTPRLFGLPGLNVIEDNGDLWIEFWWAPAFAPREAEALKIFRRHFDPKNERDFDSVKRCSAYFQPIKNSTDEAYVKRLIERLEKLYEELRKLK
jgi:hypothetical protein